jgi:ligand-binding SRPBCC domain-containing protein
MQDSVTVHVEAPPEQVWELVSDVTNTGRFSPETFEAEWLDGATGPAVGARFRGHVKRNGRGPTYWTKCTVTVCEPGQEFTFVVGTVERHPMTWGYRFVPAGSGTDVTEFYQLTDQLPLRLYWKAFGKARGRTNARNMQATLERIKAAAEDEPQE